MSFYTMRKPSATLQLPSPKALRLFDYVIILICLVVVPSAIVHGLLGIDEKAVFAALAPIIVIGTLFRNRFTIRKIDLFLGLALTLLGAMATLVAGSNSQLLMGLTLSIAIFVGHQLTITLNNFKALRAVTWFTLILLIGGLIGILYARFFGQPILDVQVGYRTTHLYLTTFSFAQIGDFIRPSGIFDEPGAFAMYAAIVTMFNDTFNKNQRLNLAVMALIIFTGSLAGLLILILYMLTSNYTRSYRKRYFKLVAVLIFTSLFIHFAYPENPFSKIVETFYSDRLQVVDGSLAGDNRSNQVSDFFELVDEEMILRGEKTATKTYDTADMSSNPFSITFGYGLIISLPYFALLLWLAVTTFRNRFHNSYTSLGLMFLLLQRPYIYHMSWSIIIASAVWLLYYSSRSRHTAQGRRDIKPVMQIVNVKN